MDNSRLSSTIRLRGILIHWQFVGVRWHHRQRCYTSVAVRKGCSRSLPLEGASGSDLWLRTEIKIRISSRAPEIGRQSESVESDRSGQLNWMLTHVLDLRVQGRHAVLKSTCFTVSVSVFEGSNLTVGSGRSGVHRSETMSEYPRMYEAHDGWVSCFDCSSHGFTTSRWNDFIGSLADLEAEDPVGRL
jgi:hypothetical protein